MRLPRPLPLRTLPKRIGISLKALSKLLYFKPSYFFLAVIVSIVFYELVFWSLNIGLLHFLLTTEFLTLFDKVEIVIGSYTGVFTLPLAPISFTLFLVSILQGATVAALVYVIKTERTINRRITKEFGGVGAAGVLSVLGLGCVPCGTSLITPLLALFFSTSSSAVAEQVGFYAAILALIVSLIAAHIAGYRLSGASSKLPYNSNPPAVQRAA